MVMENNKFMDHAKQNSPEEIPSLRQFLSSNEVEGFDIVGGKKGLNNQSQPSEIKPLNSSAMVTDTADVQSQSKESHHHRKDSVSISMPSLQVAIRAPTTLWHLLHIPSVFPVSVNRIADMDL
ncbi:hypothetical protein Pint_11174 [Pistacia integerrima]|uniref:Uncharacterized protein n=1 Tax=Pistacia integerrima TaxID=434235 RepID=A0ACC0XF11_9ROSI|nr:hypothetical protein Pint_11174 [Pistacia integerrima]